MGQVLGFSHCQEYGSVASTPDSTPPCTDGGNEESEMCDLQTAREWSDDDEVEEAGDPNDDDDEGHASSPSIWGTPRQHSFELTFSYIAIAEAEAVGSSRHYRERRRAVPRVGRTPLIRTDTLEMLLDSTDVDWETQAFFNQDEDEETSGNGALDLAEPRTANPGRRREREQGDSIRVQPSPETVDSESQRTDTGDGQEDSESQTGQTSSEIHSSQQHNPSQTTLAAEDSPTLQPESPVTLETISVKLLTSVRPTDPACSSLASVGVNSQEQLVRDHWFSAPYLTEDLTVSIRIAVMDLIYWKDTERSGMVLTALVVGLLSLFQLSIITVVSTVSVAVMCFTISVRIYYQLLYILSWGDGEHPFKSYLDMDISFSGEQADFYMQKAIFLALSAVDSLRRLFFVENLFESLKLLFLMYLVTYLGALCNGLTILIISVIALFSLPLFYERRQEQVDGFIGKIQAKIDNVKDFLRRLAQGGGPPPDTTPGGAKPKTQ
ncbi:PREDICTED: reticulon-2-like isoform X1 [Cyprinodon variegatus]|uniref:reticulon-2-like isoform X1 n=1 Tax=Cyprinodon variegatus TaxID=28743 RepID=UPI0007427C4B|nr:PREDICTED: reticulon-2-like isoform X1 [Cyprinodon variegatus]